MKNRIAFQTQFASILEVLAQAAVAEISKIVEDGTGELYLEVSRSQKEIDGLRSKLRQAESELKTVRETATRESRSVGVQVEVQFGAAGGADNGDADVPLVEHFSKKKCEIQTCDTGLDFGFAVKEEQEEECVVQILHPAESEHIAERLNDVGPEYVMFEGDHQLWSSFTQEGSDETDDPVSNATERCSRSQTIPSPIQHTAATMEMSGSTLSSLEKDDHVIDGGVMKEEADYVTGKG
ncbi:hypothetical protein GJAV_G00092000 [Gymnothorax javanicus]|nr:hypothetical protein GJAV_G00092000 [Gymnothorax javanicus]